MTFTSIHVEGLDLAGKTTACRGLAAALGPGWTVRRNRLAADNPVYELADHLRTTGAAGAGTLGHLYVAALSADLDAHTPPDRRVIQDSTVLLRSLAFHAVAGTPCVVPALEALLPRHPRFEASVVLTASLDARRQRLEWRRRNQPHEVADDDLLVVRDPARFLAMEQVLIALAREHFAARVIDTSGMSESAVVGAVLAAVSNTG